MGTAALYALDYLGGLAIFGLAYYVLNGILVEFQLIGTDNLVTEYANMFWTGALVIYLVLGLFWLPRVLKEWREGG